MKTIAIIGGGVAGRSLLLSLSKKKSQDKILLFSSDAFATPCSLNSTAIVAPRGISTGHSPLGDILVEGFNRFARHFREDHPEGVIAIPQYTGAITKIDAFKKRYPDGVVTKSIGPVALNEEVYVATEEAFLIRPHKYMNWLLKAGSSLNLQVVNSFVTEVKDNHIRTVNGEEFTADEIIFTTGVGNGSWFSLLNETKRPKSAQGCYLEFSGVDFKDSFSLTLEGDNLIYDAETKILLLGSTTHETNLELPQEKELKEIYERVSSRISLSLPPFSSAVMKTGLREKASKRESYILKSGMYSAIGGLYKNGYRLSLTLAEKLLNS